MKFIISQLIKKWKFQSALTKTKWKTNLSWLDFETSYANQWVFSNSAALNSFGLDIFVKYKNFAKQFLFSFTSAIVTLLTEVSPNSFKLSVSSLLLLAKLTKPCQVVYQNLRFIILIFSSIFRFLLWHLFYSIKRNQISKCEERIMFQALPSTSYVGCYF